MVCISSSALLSPEILAPAFSKAQRLDQLLRRECSRKLFPRGCRGRPVRCKPSRRTMLHIDDCQDTENNCSFESTVVAAQT